MALYKDMPWEQDPDLLERAIEAVVESEMDNPAHFIFPFGDIRRAIDIEVRARFMVMLHDIGAIRWTL